jgi:hypothetical protein
VPDYQDSGDYCQFILRFIVLLDTGTSAERHTELSGSSSSSAAADLRISMAADNPRYVVERIAARNGVFSEEMKERAKHDPMVADLLESNQHLRKIANNSTFRYAMFICSV